MQPIRPLLEAIEPSCSVLPWGVANIASAGLVLAWDNRPESSRSILEAMASRYGEVIDTDCLDLPDGISVIGVLFKPTPGEFDPAIADAASLLRGEMLLAGNRTDPDAPMPF